MTRRVLARAMGVGADARRALATDAPGSVAAVFKSSLYIRFGGGPDRWVCIGGDRLGFGPLNVPCRALTFGDWREVAQPGFPAAVERRDIHLAGGTVALNGAPVRPCPAAPSWTPASLAAGLQALSAALPAELTGEGLAAFGRPAATPRTLVEKAAAGPVEQLFRWAAGRSGADKKCPSGAVSGLIGLGPGLTPSGDDFLAGFVVALGAAGGRSKARELSREIDEKARRLTSELSAAHLAAAGRGALKEHLQALLYAVLAGRGRAVRAGVARLSAEPHYSSLDAVAGLATAFRASLTVGRRA